MHCSLVGSDYGGGRLVLGIYRTRWRARALNCNRSLCIRAATDHYHAGSTYNLVSDWKMLAVLCKQFSANISHFYVTQCRVENQILPFSTIIFHAGIALHLITRCSYFTLDASAKTTLNSQWLWLTHICVLRPIYLHIHFVQTSTSYI